MVRARLRLGALLAGILFASPVQAIPYWFAWEGNDFPENEGWERSVHGQPDVRTLADGIMTLDGLNTTGGWDVYVRLPVGTLHVDPGETFIMRWRVRVDTVLRREMDPTVFLYSDAFTAMAVDLGVSRILLFYEGVYIPVDPSVFHSYEIRTTDMLTYALRIDGVLVREGEFTPVSQGSLIGWGDGSYPTRSRSSWDYFRYGVIPEPPGIAAAVVLGFTTASVRRQRR